MNFKHVLFCLSLLIGAVACEKTDLETKPLEQKPIPALADFTFTTNSDDNLYLPQGQNGPQGLIVNFENLSTNASSYFWSFGDGNATSTEANPTYTYMLPGQYTVTLNAIYGQDTAVINRVVQVNFFRKKVLGEFNFNDKVSKVNNQAKDSTKLEAVVVNGEGRYDTVKVVLAISGVRFQASQDDSLKVNITGNLGLLNASKVIVGEMSDSVNNVIVVNPQPYGKNGILDGTIEGKFTFSGTEVDYVYIYTRNNKKVWYSGRASRRR